MKCKNGRKDSVTYKTMVTQVTLDQRMSRGVRPQQPNPGKVTGAGRGSRVSTQVSSASLGLRWGYPPGQRGSSRTNAWTETSMDTLPY